MRSVTALFPAAPNGYAALSNSPADILPSFIQPMGCGDSDQQERMGNAAVSGIALPEAVGARRLPHSPTDSAATRQGELPA